MCADANPSAVDRLLGRQIHGYSLVRCIGKGGMGLVYEARHMEMGQRAAVKVLNRELFSDDKVLQRFFNEARALSVVQHSGVVQIFNFGQLADGTAFIMMEFLDGQPLVNYLSYSQLHGHPLALPLVVELGRQIAAALAVSHAKGVVHRDLKPENVFIVPDEVTPLGERVKLLDFGIAKFLDGPTRKTTVGTVLGTPHYMAPEQCEGAQNLDEKVDVYSLGVMLYEMISGHLPFFADTTAAIMRQHLFKDPPPLTVQVAALPPAVAELVHRMLAKQPTARPSMPEVFAALEELQRSVSALPSGQQLALRLVLPETPYVVGGSQQAADPFAHTVSGDAEAVAARTAAPRGARGLVGALLALTAICLLAALVLRTQQHPEKARSAAIVTLPVAPSIPSATALPAAPPAPAGVQQGLALDLGRAAPDQAPDRATDAPPNSVSRRRAVKPRGDGKKAATALRPGDAATFPEEDAEQAWR